MVLKVAIVDDSRELALSIKSYLEQYDMKVVGMCHNGKDAVHMIETCDFDLLLLDLILPYIDGIGLLEKYIPRSHEYKIICLSAFGKDSILSKAMSLGVDYFILKPINFDNFISRIYQICNMDFVNHTDQLLNNLGFNNKYKGTRYLKDALDIVSKHPNEKIQLTIKLYPEIAELHQVKPANVERSIRHAIEKAWSNGLEQIFNEQGRYVKPTIGELIKFLKDG
ncbi:response regulator [Macrococcoides caseolyticum]|uniref:response regulator n=1 Tax=Macrococcoides caseolyticum TaxID=69966 RepID=UPI000C34568B|nr:sporulation initiation factor Spo0A C-terminal domain-containing protein [Macrococcus caseolyticus]PKE20110.1 hypothetical protein CW679_02160 [Macrococcus caseolyticus]PKF41844.1 hypothetical protein CW661_01530 [Macrococcus caseolyticus]QYA34492.1 response regulator [Macrococcus caseolyticus]